MITYFRMVYLVYSHLGVKMQCPRVAARRRGVERGETVESNRIWSRQKKKKKPPNGNKNWKNNVFQTR